MKCLQAWHCMWILPLKPASGESFIAKGLLHLQGMFIQNGLLKTTLMDEQGNYLGLSKLLGNLVASTAAAMKTGTAAATNQHCRCRGRCLGSPASQ